jgi:putative hydrolase of the HAD superfamily
VTPSTEAPAQALVLDFGGVISRTMFETHDLTEQALGLAPGTLTWRGPFDPASDALWRDMQARRISERDYWLARTREVGAALGEDWHDMQTLVRRARGAEPDRIIRPETLTLIEAAKRAGRRLAILSNELDLFYGTELRQRLTCLRHFDVIVDATYTHCLKPDPQAYAQCVRQLQLPAAQCVFVDDQMRNIEGARRAGLLTVWFDVNAPHASCTAAARLLGLNCDL